MGKKKISEDRLLKEKERKERKSSGKSLRFCTPVEDGRTDIRMYEYVRERTKNLPEVHLVVKWPQEGGGG